MLDMKHAWALSVLVHSGTRLTYECPDARAGSTAWVLCGNQVATKYMGMRIGRKYPLTLGGVDTRLLKYEVLARVDRSKQLVTQ